MRGAADPSCRAADVDRLRGVLLEVRANDPNGSIALALGHRERAARAQRNVVLGDLVALREVGIEVVLAVEERVLGDLAPQREPEFDRRFDRGTVRHRQRTRMREADGTGVGVRLASPSRRTRAEHLRSRLQLHVDLEPDDRFPALAHRSLSGT
jgi:hypothetical protein